MAVENKVNEPRIICFACGANLDKPFFWIGTTLCRSCNDRANAPVDEDMIAAYRRIYPDDADVTEESFLAARAEANRDANRRYFTDQPSR